MLFIGDIMNINDIYRCARYYRDNYINQFYIVTTYNDNTFIVVGEKKNFPHLMGIPHNKLISNGYPKSAKFYADILNNVPITTRLIPKNITINSKMYIKAFNFDKSQSVLRKSHLPIVINYDASKTDRKLNSVDKLIVDPVSGFMLGCIENTMINITNDIRLKKYCISTWMDEHESEEKLREKYIYNQDIEVIKTVLTLGTEANQIEPLKSYQINNKEKKKIIEILNRCNANLLVNKRVLQNYISLIDDSIVNCNINNVNYSKVMKESTNHQSKSEEFRGAKFDGDFLDKVMGEILSK